MPLARLGDGVSLHYEEEGEGQPLVWVAGTGHSASVWSKFQIPVFSDGYRCITVDMRGCGGSDEPEGEYSIASMAADVAAFLHHLSLDSAHFVGFSMGSAILQELALCDPQLVRSAVMWATWSCTAQEHHIRHHFEARLAALERAPIDVFRAASFWAWAPSFVEDEPDRMTELQQFLAEAAVVPQHVWAEQFRADLGHDTASRLPAIRCSTLVLYGSEDLITLPRYNHRVAEAIEGAELRCIEGAGHMAFVERPQESNRVIRDFLDRLS